MKALILLALLIGPAALAADDSLPAPPTGAKRIDANGPGAAIYNAPTAIPTSDNVEDYVRWVMSYVEPAKKNLLATNAYMHPLKYDRRSGKAPDGCVWHKDAYNFKYVGPEKAADGNTWYIYDVSCYSGKNGESVKSLVYYRLRAKYTPQDCVSEAKIREHFKKPGTRNRDGALAYVNISNSFCKLYVEPADLRKPITAAYSLSPEDVADVLNKQGNLRNHISAIETRRDPKKTGKDEEDDHFSTKVKVKGVTVEEAD